MKTQAFYNHPNMLEDFSKEFNGNNIYGLEYILDELDETKEASKSIKSDSTNTDWFGLSDLCI
ncbi:MAG: hypothetical protein L3J75_00050 [Methylococcaceae bacterium]|nr:hypothetical protein [Methylococcaceae bacterium]